MGVRWVAVGEGLRPRALDVLGSDLSAIVDMVLLRTHDDEYRAASAQGRVTFRRLLVDGPAASSTFETVTVEGADPFAFQSPGHLAGLDAEQATPHPPRHENAYPLA